MYNKNGVKLTNSDIENTFLIACDLLYYGYNFNYFYDNYTQLLKKDDALTIWKKAVRKMEV